jgi:hypothetical protein
MESLMCDRRSLLRGALGMGLAFAWPARRAEASDGGKARSLIVLWLEGGPSQLETWDPHPGTKIGGPTRAIDTSVPDLKIAAGYPRLAEMMCHLSLIRSVTSKEGDHERATRYVKSGCRPSSTRRAPSIGAGVACELTRDDARIPQHVALGPQRWPGWGGDLGAEYNAFLVRDPGRRIDNLEPTADADRHAQRIANVDVVNRAFLEGRASRLNETRYQKTLDRALAMMSAEDLAAFKLADEPSEVRNRYGDHAFGRGCLVARRLIERGVHAIEVTLGGFDSHAGNFEAHRTRAAELDAPFAALVSDLVERDLFRRTIILAIGEFGRTPAINALDGRDHWPHAFSCIVGGGGLRSGVVVGATDPSGVEKLPKDPVAVEDVTATIFDRFGIDPRTEHQTPAGRPFELSSGKRIARLCT